MRGRITGEKVICFLYIIELPRQQTVFTRSSFPSHARCLLVRRRLLILPSLQVLFDSLDHLIANLRRLGKAWAEVALDLFELLAVAFQVSEGDAVGPVLLARLVHEAQRVLSDQAKTYACGESEFEVISHVCTVGDGIVDTLVEQVFVAVQVLGNT